MGDTSKSPPPQIASQDFRGKSDSNGWDGDWSGEFSVDNDRLVVTSETELPAYCIIRNEPVDVAQGKWVTLYWAPQLAYLLMLGGPIGFLAVSLLRKQCRLRFYLSKEIRWRYTRSLLIRWLIVIQLIVGSIVWAVAANGPVWLIAASLFSLVILVFGNEPLKVESHRDGKFWISGFSQEYLERLRWIEHKQKKQTGSYW